MGKDTELLLKLLTQGKSKTKQKSKQKNGLGSYIRSAIVIAFFIWLLHFVGSNYSDNSIPDYEIRSPIVRK